MRNHQYRLAGFANKKEYVAWVKEEAADAKVRAEEDEVEAERQASGYWYGSPQHQAYGDVWLFGAVGQEEHDNYQYDEYQGDVDHYLD